jgi:hypothetical protein
MNRCNGKSGFLRIGVTIETKRTIEGVTLIMGRNGITSISRWYGVGWVYSLPQATGKKQVRAKGGGNNGTG